VSVRERAVLQRLKAAEWRGGKLGGDWDGSPGAVMLVIESRASTGRRQKRTWPLGNKTIRSGDAPKMTVTREGRSNGAELFGRASTGDGFQS